MLPKSTPDIEIVPIDPQRLKPHPRNPFLYGEEEDIWELVEQIQVSGWIRPLLVTPKHIIISGHRRWRAALELGIEQVRVEVRAFPNQTAQLEALLLENAARPKTREQLVREANAWKEVVAAKAKRRQKAGVRLDDEELVKIFSEGSRGNTRDIVAAKVGLGSGMTYAKAAKVVKLIDNAVSQDDLETASAWRKILNTQSISAAYQLLLLPVKKREDILELIAIGEAETTKEAQFILEAANSDDARIFVAGDLAIISIDKVNVISAKETQWNGCWGVIEDVLAAEGATSRLKAIQGKETRQKAQKKIGACFVNKPSLLRSNEKSTPIISNSSTELFFWRIIFDGLDCHHATAKKSLDTIGDFGGKFSGVPFYREVALKNYKDFYHCPCGMLKRFGFQFFELGYNKSLNLERFFIWSLTVPNGLMSIF